MKEKFSVKKKKKKMETSQFAHTTEKQYSHTIPVRLPITSIIAADRRESRSRGRVEMAGGTDGRRPRERKRDRQTERQREKERQRQTHRDKE